MIVQNKNLGDRVLFYILVFCIFSFKIAYGRSGGELFIRPDDVLIVIAFFILLARNAVHWSLLSKPTVFYLLFVGQGVASALWNSYFDRVNLFVSLAFTVRLVQYMCFYLIGYQITKAGFEITKTMRVYLGVLIIVIPLQSFHILPTPSGLGPERASGNTNGPYEFALVAAFLLCYLGYKEKSRLAGLASAVFVVMSASRITFLGLIVSLFRMLFRWGRRSLQSAILASATLLFAGFAGFTLITAASSLKESNIGLFQRLGSAFSSKTGSNFVDVYKISPVFSTSDDYIQGTFSHGCDFNQCDDDTDASAAIRLYKWATLIKSTVANWDSALIGLGPSFATTAVDGYYVRLLAEQGVVGIILFSIAIGAFWWNRPEQWAFREYVVIALVSGLFIDIFTSYKAMLLLWLWHGVEEAKHSMKKQQEEEDIQKAEAVGVTR